jgi:hypothetical protein
MNMPRSQTNPQKSEVIPALERDEVVPVSRKSLGTMPASLKSAGAGGDKVKRALRWVITCLPLGGIAWASFLPLQTWMQQALILVTLIWFYVFFLLDTFFLGG